MGFTAAIIPGLILGAGSVAAARSQNAALQSSANAQQDAANAQQRQLEDAAELEQLRNRQETSAIIGRLRVAAGEAGVGFGGSFSALERQALTDAELNSSIIQQNLVNQIQAVQSGATANIAALESSLTNPLLAGLTSGLGGFSTGLQIGQAVTEVGRTNSTPIPDPYSPVPPPVI